MYRVIATGPIREFQITLGLVEGYSDDGLKHPPKAAVTAIAKWYKLRQDEPTLTVTSIVTQGAIVYRKVEPCVVVTGAASPITQTNVSDKAFKEAVLDLAKWLGEQFNQVRVYVQVLGEIVVLEHEA